MNIRQKSVKSVSVNSENLEEHGITAIFNVTCGLSLNM